MEKVIILKRKYCLIYGRIYDVILSYRNKNAKASTFIS